MKRFIAIVLCIVMCASVISANTLTAFAANSETSFFDVKSTGMKKSEISFIINLKPNVVRFNGAILNIEFDTSILELKSATPVYTKDADDNDVAYAMSATFLFDMLMIVLFPIMGRAMGMSDEAFGLWAGTAVNDTSSVVATGYAFSEAAGDFATMVKLTRTLCIIPTVVIFAFINLNIKRKEAKKQGLDESELKANFSIKKIFPWFILGFVLMSIIASIFSIPEVVVTNTKTISKFLMVSALAAIGLNTSFSSIKKSGIRPMVHGFIISALVVVVALLVEIAMGIV